MRTSSISALALAWASTTVALPSSPRNDNGSAHEAGAVFAMTNAVDNEVIAFSRGSDGSLTQVGRVSTGGHGQGVDFDTQGGLQVNEDHSFLYAVNPADDLITVFSVDGSSLNKVQTIYAGDQPLSLSLSSTGYLYALDGSVASTGIFGFKVDKKDGTLTPLTNTTIPLSTPIGVPGVIAFAPDGRSLIVTNKVGSSIDVFSVDASGHASSAPVTTMVSSGERPFGAVFNKKDTLYVVESGLSSLQNAGLSTYHLNSGKTPSLTAVAKAVKNGQTDGCWIVVTPDDRFAYTANFVSSSISSYAISGNGTATLINGTAAEPGADSEPVDLAMSSDGAYLYCLLRGAGAVVGYKIEKDGSLTQVAGLFGQGQGLPPANGASGLAAF